MENPIWMNFTVGDIHSLKSKNHDMTFGSGWIQCFRGRRPVTQPLFKLTESSEVALNWKQSFIQGSIPLNMRFLEIPFQISENARQHILGCRCSLALLWDKLSKEMKVKQQYYMIHDFSTLWQDILEICLELTEIWWMSWELVIQMHFSCTYVFFEIAWTNFCRGES